MGAEPKSDIAGRTSSPSDPSPQTQPRRMNVVLFGEAGVGKSSVINLIAQRDVAQVSLGVIGRTMQSTPYDIISFDGMEFTLFDTSGLEQPQMGVSGYLRALEKAYELIVKLSAAGGVHLLLFCMRGGKVTATTQSNYRLFFECLCGTKVPVALVFTSLAREAAMEDWWDRNKSYMEHYGIKSDGHACVRTVHDDTPEGALEYADSETKIRELLKTCALRDVGFCPEQHSWFARLGRVMMNFIAKHKDPKGKGIMKVLTHRCGLDSGTAKKIADMMVNGEAEGRTPSPRVPLPPAQSRSINIVLFGEAGVGKSSVVNLIAGRHVARVSPDANRCTPQSTRYNISFDDTNFAIFEFIGLEASQMTVNGYLKAIEEMYELIVKLGAAGGVHLLLFCMSKNRIKGPTQANYRLFFEYLCSRKVPIVLVFTGLEEEEQMENWWTRNKTDIEQEHGLNSDGHACITTVNDNTPEEDLKYTESQRKIREVLKACARVRNEGFSPEQHSWFAKVGKEMGSFVENRRKPRRRDVMRVLVDRCNLDRETAKKIADMMKKGDTETKESNQEQQNTTEPRSADALEGKDKSGTSNEKAAHPTSTHSQNDVGPVRPTVGLEGRDKTGAADGKAAHPTLTHTQNDVEAGFRTVGLKGKVKSRVAGEKATHPTLAHPQSESVQPTVWLEGKDKSRIVSAKAAHPSLAHPQNEPVHPTVLPVGKDTTEASNNEATHRTLVHLQNDVDAGPRTVMLEGMDESRVAVEKMARRRTFALQQNDVAIGPGKYR